MTENKEEEEKRQIQKLLREYDSNRGMAALVCGRPVELMPAQEQERIINGFCTTENLEILKVSREKLAFVKSMPVAQSEIDKISAAIPVLDALLDYFTAYSQSAITLSELRDKVRAKLEKPIPDTQDGLIDSLSYLIDILVYLGTQPVETKDSWDRMVDCVQMHDSLTRTLTVCVELQKITTEANTNARQSVAIATTEELADSCRDYLERFFSGALAHDGLPGQFKVLVDGLKELWMKPEQADE